MISTIWSSPYKISGSYYFNWRVIPQSESSQWWSWIANDPKVGLQSNEPEHFILTDKEAGYMKLHQIYMSFKAFDLWETGSKPSRWSWFAIRKWITIKNQQKYISGSNIFFIFTYGPRWASYTPTPHPPTHKFPSGATPIMGEVGDWKI